MNQEHPRRGPGDAAASCSIVSSLLGFAERQPDAPAFIDHARRVTYGELGARVLDVAAWLDEIGVRTGDAVALPLDERDIRPLGAMQLFYALCYLGAVVLPVYAEVPDARWPELLRHFDARWLISARASGTVEHAVSINPHRFDDREPGGSDAAPRGDEPARPMFYQFTSGTTGVPKACLFTVEDVARWTLMHSNPYASGASDRQVPALRRPSKVGLRYLLRIHAFGGALVNVRFPKSRQELGDLIREFGVTQLAASPGQVRRLLRSEAPDGEALPALRVLSVTGAPLLLHEIAAARQNITPNVFIAYASSETGVLSCLRPEDPLVREGGVGRLLAGVEGEVVNDEDRPVAAGQVGMLRFRSPAMTDGYFGNAAATAQRFRAGWFYPGDVGTIDAAGYVTLHGRADEVINFGGVKIAPEDVERVLTTYPGVLDPAVVGLPHPIAGEVPVAFLVLQSDIGESALRQFCARHLDGKHVPYAFVRVDSIPRSAESKILRHRLRESHSVSQRR